MNKELPGPAPDDWSGNTPRRSRDCLPVLVLLLAIAGLLGWGLGWGTYQAVAAVVSR